MTNQNLSRRTFGIISHPDAGKTTLTEKLLLFGGAIHVAGAIKAKKAARHATSDFMEIEKQRGISVSTSVLSFNYLDKKINILDTPGHKDFAEDTYRTLTAVDSVIVVIDVAKGVEEQTEKLVKVCKMRKIPIMIFVNKCDREGKDAFDLMDELEKKLGFNISPISFPIGIGASIYLEEFAPKNKLTELIEVNIANLAAVPSIVFGLLGLGILLNVFGFPRSTPLVGGTVLALMTLPTIIIACRASLKAVPPSIKEGALAMGASKMQAVFHHQVPLALPGTLTGTIIGLAQALGETAPLIMIGMIAFIPNIPTGFTEPSAALPVQIYLWVESAERGFQEKTAAAIMMILIFLFLMNAIAVFLRSRFERKW